MKLSVIEASDRLIDLINPDRPEVFEVEDPLMGPTVSNPVPPINNHFLMVTKIILEDRPRIIHHCYTNQNVKYKSFGKMIYDVLIFL